MNIQFLRRNLLFIATAIAMTVYIGWRTLFTLPLEYGLPSLIVGLLLLFCEIVAGLEAVEQYLNMAYSVKPELPEIPDVWYPDVDVFIPTHNEGVDILYKTVNACTHMAYPDPAKVHIFLCDDTNRPQVRELAEKMGVGYFGLANNKQAKAGNLNNGLRQTSSPLVATFDADMIPHRDFLMRTVPYFFLPVMKQNEQGQWVPKTKDEIDPKQEIGFIQTPQSFYSPDLFQYNLHAEERVPNEQDYFFREINVGRNRSNTPIFAGTNVVISRKAVEEVGGIAVDTITEDFETGLKIQAKGYTSYAIKPVLAHGLTPPSIGSLITQRERWARGCLQSMRHVQPFFRSNFTLAAKFSYLACLVYWWTFFRRLVYIAAPILSVLFSIHVVECELWEILMFWLPYYLLNNRTLSVLSGNTRTQHWSNLIDTILFPYIIIPVFLETIGVKKKKFVVTQKAPGKQTQNNLALAMPHILLLGASAVALFLCIIESLEIRSVYNAIIIFWLIVNGKNLMLSVFFMLGRDNYRTTYRIGAEVPVTVEYDGHTHQATTKDLSEHGMRLVFPYPAFLPDHEPFAVHLETDQYKATVTCEVAHVHAGEKGEWFYSLKIREMDEANQREYMQIVFDRRHSLPDSIVETFSVLDDFRLNIDKRLANPTRPSQRKLPRVPMRASSVLPDGRAVKIENFNYKFVRLSESGGAPAGDVTDLPFVDDLSLQLAPVKDTPSGKGLYKILNWEELVRKPDLPQALAGLATA